jgi:hypothetical protein
MVLFYLKQILKCLKSSCENLESWQNCEVGIIYLFIMTSLEKNTLGRPRILKGDGSDRDAYRNGQEFAVYMTEDGTKVVKVPHLFIPFKKSFLKVADQIRQMLLYVLWRPASGKRLKDMYSKHKGTLQRITKRNPRLLHASTEMLENETVIFPGDDEPHTLPFVYVDSFDPNFQESLLMYTDLQRNPALIGELADWTIAAWDTYTESRACPDLVSMFSFLRGLRVLIRNKLCEAFFGSLGEKYDLGDSDITFGNLSISPPPENILGTDECLKLSDIGMLDSEVVTPPFIADFFSRLTVASLIELISIANHEAPVSALSDEQVSKLTKIYSELGLPMKLLIVVLRTLLRKNIADILRNANGRSQSLSPAPA